MILSRIAHLPTTLTYETVASPHPETRHLARPSGRKFFLGGKKREEKEEIFEKLLQNFEIFFWNKDKLIEEIFEENVSIV